MTQIHNIAVIEDRPEDRFFTGLALKDAFPNCRIIEFTYAEEALRYLRSPDRPRLDIILADIAMPMMDGITFADAFAELYTELKGSARLFLISSSIDPIDRKNANLHGAVAGFLEKPVTSEALLELAEPAS